MALKLCVPNFAESVVINCFYAETGLEQVLVAAFILDTDNIDRFLVLFIE